MTKEDAANKLFDEVNAIVSVSFKGAELAYHKQFKKWRVAGRFGLNTPLQREELMPKFKGTGMVVTPTGAPLSDYIAVIKIYDDV